MDNPKTPVQPQQNPTTPTTFGNLDNQTPVVSTNSQAPPASATVPQVTPNQQPAQGFPTQQPPPVPPAQGSGVQVQGGKKPKGKVILIIAIVLILLLGLGGGTFYIQQQRSSATDEEIQTRETVEEVVDETSEFTDLTETVRPEDEVIDYSSSDLIAAVTKLLSEESYFLDDTSVLTYESGCKLSKTYSAKKNIDDYFFRSESLFTTENVRSICETDGIAQVFLETYSVNQAIHSRKALTEQLTLVDATVTSSGALAPQVTLSQLIPFPTLLAVRRASKVQDRELIKVFSGFSATDQNFEYTFTVNSEGRIIDAEYKIDYGKLGYVDQGNFKVVYVAENIVVPPIQ